MEVLNAFTPAPVINYTHNRISIDLLWIKLMDFVDEKGYIIMSSYTNSPDAEKYGIVANQHYRVISVKTYNEVEILKLRNHSCAFEWR